MRIIIETIEHNDQRYETPGDWYEQDGTLHIKVSRMDNLNYEFLVGLHEMIEAHVCLMRGITEKDVTEFDKAFEERRVEGNEDEPGNEPDAPYRREHLLATGIETVMASILGVDWKTYDKKVGSLIKEKDNNGI